MRTSERPTTGRERLRNEEKRSPRVYAEEQVDWPSASTFLERFVETFVPGLCRAPNLVLQRLVDIVLSIRFDNEKSSLYVDVA